MGQRAAAEAHQGSQLQCSLVLHVHPSRRYRLKKKLRLSRELRNSSIDTALGDEDYGDQERAIERPKTKVLKKKNFDQNIAFQKQ